MFSIKNSLVTLSLLKRDFFISSFPGKIVFGEVFDGKFEAYKHFLLFRCNYCKFYEKVVDIVRATRDEKRSRDVILAEDIFTYYWQIHETGVKLMIEKFETDLVFSTLFTFEEFNNLLDCFKELLLSSLLLKTRDIDIINKISSLDLKQIIEMQNSSQCEEFKKLLAITSDYNQHILVKMNYDIILLLHKLNHVVTTSYREDFQNQLKNSAP